jgi:hypothetical protein
LKERRKKMRRGRRGGRRRKQLLDDLKEKRRQRKHQITLAGELAFKQATKLLRTDYTMNELGNSVKIFMFQDIISNILNRTFTSMFEHKSSIQRRLYHI